MTRTPAPSSPPTVHLDPGLVDLSGEALLALGVDLGEVAAGGERPLQHPRCDRRVEQRGRGVAGLWDGAHRSPLRGASSAREPAASISAAAAS